MLLYSLIDDNLFLLGAFQLLILHIYFLAMHSSRQKGETGTLGCHTGTPIKMQLHSEEQQTDAFGKLGTSIIFLKHLSP